MKTPVILRVFKSSQLIEVKQFDVDQIIVGNGGDVQLNLVDAGVAPIHCLIELRDSGYYLCDLGSASGTFKNNNQILDEPISSGDSIGIGPFQVQFFVGVPKPKAPPTIVPPAEKKTEEAPQKIVPVAAVVPQPPAPPPQAPAAIPTAKPAESVAPDRAAGAAESGATPAPPRLPEQAVRVGKAAAGQKNGGDAKNGRKYTKTYAPPSEIKDLRQHLKPTKGGTLEVLVAWKERIFETMHFTESSRILSIGPVKADIAVSNQFVGATQPFVQLAQGVANVNLPAGATIEVITAATRFSQDDLLRTGKAVGTGATLSLKMEQGDLVCISFGETLHLYLRFVTTPPKPIAASLLDMTGGEATGLIVAVMIVSLLALVVEVLFLKN